MADGFEDMSPSSLNFEKNRLCYSGQKCRKLPEVLVKLYGSKVHSLDLSYNDISTLRGLEGFPFLKELVLDNNALGDGIIFPELPQLHTLSLNKNNICDLESLLGQITQKMPNIIYLSLLGNRACPNQLSSEENDDEDYQRYRYYVIHHLPNLRFLDSKRVCSGERQEAKRRGKFMNVVRPKQLELVNEEPQDVCVVGRFTPLPKTMRNPQDYKGAYGKCRYRYSGKNSEGNRFISNTDL